MGVQISDLTAQVNKNQLNFHKHMGNKAKSTTEGGRGQKGLTWVTQNHGQHREDRTAAIYNHQVFWIKMDRCLARLGQDQVTSCHRNGFPLALE